MTIYKSSGVDIDASDHFVQMIKERIALRGWSAEAQEIGKFAGAGIIPRGSTHLAASADGTGAKAILAALLGNFEGLGQDGVAMAAVDTYVAGKKPLYLVDVLDVAHLKPNLHIQIIDSILSACILAECRLLGGETAELPDMFRYAWMVNLNVFAVGFSSQAEVFEPVQPGQRVYGWLSHGPGSNGFSLLRKTFRLRGGGRQQTRQRLEIYSRDLGMTLGEALLEPTPIYIHDIEGFRELGVKFAGHAHITGGGMRGNIPRILPDNCKVVIDRSSWRRPPIFRLAQEMGDISQQEMDRVLNQGIMMISIIADENDVMMLGHHDLRRIGYVEQRSKNEPQVELTGEYNDI